MQAADVLHRLHEAGITLAIEGVRLMAHGRLSDGLREAIRANRAALMAHVATRDHLARLAAADGLPADLVPSLHADELAQAHEQLESLPAHNRDEVAAWYLRQLHHDRQRHPHGCKAACPWCRTGAPL